MKKSLLLIVPFIIFSCGNEPKELTEAEKQKSDSLSKAEQRMKADSMKKKNPLLILPPDSTYTGEYLDKYPNGITKYKGFFRFGERHGQWMSFYPNGEPWSEMHYDKGLKHGPNITYYENKKMRYSGWYKKDQQDSIWFYYDTLGKLEKKALFKNGRLEKELPIN
jgi:antitoxin component YwqK of YwqJK toxin-antitoxin module